MRNRESNRTANVNLVPMRANGVESGDKTATFGQRRVNPSYRAKPTASSTQYAADGGMEMSWVPSSGAVDVDDMLVPGGQRPKKGKTKRPGVESFGAGMEKGGQEQFAEMGESERKGRTKRRQGVRSGSKNVFRGIGN